jgi:hypothetical protein
VAETDGGSTPKPKKTPKKTNPTYAIVRVTDKDGNPAPAGELRTGYRLEVLAKAFEGPTQEKASDDFAENHLPVGERSGTIGALLANSFRSFEYETETITVTRKKQPPEPGPPA